MHRPPRPFGNTPKIRWQQAIYDAMGELEPRIGPGVYLQDTVRATLRRLMGGRNNRETPEQDDGDPAVIIFGYGVNKWGPFVTGTAIVGTSVLLSDFSAPPELQPYFTYNGAVVSYPGVLFPPGIPLPGTFRFTSPFRRHRCRVGGLTTGSGWQTPVPEILSPGESVDFNAPQSVSAQGASWVAVRI